MSSTLVAESTAIRSPAPRILAKTPEFSRSNRAVFLGGFSTFSLLYCVQPMMPIFAKEFGLTPVQSSWSLSISSAALAFTLIFAGAISDSIGRKSVMCMALFLSALTTIGSAFSQSYTEFLIMRGILGVTLAGLPAVAMAYLSEEIDATSLGYSMGLYISGNALGGMTGRVFVSFLSDMYSWRIAIGIVGVASLLASIEFWRSLPKSRHFRKTDFDASSIINGLIGHFRDEGLPWLFMLAFLLMGCLVSLYNYMGFRLIEPQFGLRQSQMAAIFSLYIMGIFSSVWTGKLADKFGRRRVLWLVISIMLTGLLLTLSNSLIWIILGIALFTYGFFGSHSVASSWVGRRAKPPQALASALYLLFYYLGSSLVSVVAGILWASHKWPGVVITLSVCLAGCMLIALRLRNLMPLTVDASAVPTPSIAPENSGA